MGFKRHSVPASIFPLSVASNGRYLKSPNATPSPVFGDSSWYLWLDLSPTDYATYLADDVAKGFNAQLAVAIEHKFTVNKPPKNWSGDLPFTKRLDGATYTGSPNGTTSVNGNTSQYAADPYSNINNEAPDFTQLNSTYWTPLDTFLSTCLALEQVVVLFPAYIGFGAGDEGWLNEMVANDAVTGAGGLTGQPYANASKSKLWNYGAWLGNRYKNQANIIWLDGGDYGSGGSSGTFTSPQKAAVDSVMQGIKSQASQPHTAHWSRPSLASDVTLTSAFDIESIYTDTTPATEAASGYAHSPAAPVVQVEGEYDGTLNAAGSAPYRQYMWWLYTSGATGFFGDASPSPGPIWTFQTTSGGWQSLLNSQGRQDMARLIAFIRARPWWRLVPSGTSGMKTLVTVNAGSGSSLISAAADSSGTCLVAYVPNGSSGAFTVDMTALTSGSNLATCRWFDPTNGNFTAIGSISTTTTHSFTPPGTNAGGTYSDWVLLCEAQ